MRVGAVRVNTARVISTPTVLAIKIHDNNYRQMIPANKYWDDFQLRCRIRSIQRSNF